MLPRSRTNRSTGPGCGLTDAVRLRGGRSVSLSSPTLLSCRAALTFAMWERHALQPAVANLLTNAVEDEPPCGIAGGETLGMLDVVRERLHALNRFLGQRVPRKRNHAGSPPAGGRRIPSPSASLSTSN